MLNFSIPDLSMKPRADEILRHQNSQSCVYCFASTFMWSARYGTQAAFDGDALYLRYGRDGLLYASPVGEFEWNHALELMASDAKKHNMPLRIFAEGCQAKELDTLFPGRFSVQEMRDDFEYVYLAQDLINLSGRRYHSKRNHIAKFNRAHPDWLYQDVCTDNLPDCIAVADGWCEANNCNGNDELCHENCAIRCALSNIDALGLIGGIIYSDGKPVAFTLGERLNSDTFVVHFEKALPEYAEAYTVINQAFAMHNLGTYTYINREEDLGDEGLRKAKLSYRPCHMVEKFLLTER